MKDTPAVKPESAYIKAFRFMLGLFMYGLLTAILLGGLAFWWGTQQFTKPSAILDTPQEFVVERGQGTNAIASRLYQDSIIDDPFIFMIGTTILGQHTNLQAGEYLITPQMSQRDIMNLMVDGKTVARRVTVREGLTSFEVVQLLNGVEQLNGEITDIPPEGSLLPNTYDYQRGEDRNAVLMRMSIAMRDIIYDVCDGTYNDLYPATIGYDYDRECENLSAPIRTVGDILTLASIIEKETAVPSERRRVAGVFVNRLRQGIPLQTDPTVIYAITKGEHKNDGKGPLGRRLLRKDLTYDSPYNTYKYAGLPPGPIANPGKASIEAALNPEAHDYIFFVADGSGGHAFAKTLAEHNRNVAKWRKIRREQSK